jgi:hypothetical protein
MLWHEYVNHLAKFYLYKKIVQLIYITILLFNINNFLYIEN